MAIGQQGEVPAARERGLTGLLADLVRDSARLGAQELSLLRAELGERTNNLIGGLIMLGAAAVFAIIGLSLAVEALVGWLTIVLQSELAAILICAGGAVALSVVLFVIGRGRLDPAHLAPSRAAQSMKEDLNIITRRV